MTSKILVIADSHGNKNGILETVKITMPDLILHIGDHDTDLNILDSQFSDIPRRAVRGNGDIRSRELEEDEFVYAGLRFYMTHGHLHGVKRGMDTIIEAAHARDADILLFGHTHIPFYATHSGLTILNPGALNAGTKTYAVLVIEDREIKHEFLRLN